MSKNYKDTLLMPKTNFEMRANLSQKEPIIQKFWQDKQVYKELLKKNQNQTPFILHDGPPYANGDLHLGHALNKTLKDIVVRYYNAKGFYAPFIAGWDTHGLPIEQAVSNQGLDRKKISLTAFREACQKYASTQIENQKAQFQKLGLLTDFQDYYVTYDKFHEATQIKLFAKMVEQEVVYRNLYPVYWSPSSESALAEAEIEYISKKSPAIYVKFYLKNAPEPFKDANLVIWTTTPWTLPSNQLLAVNVEFEYVLIEANNEKYIVATKLVDNFITATKLENHQIIKTFKGSELIGLKPIHPLYKRISPVVHGDHVNLESGTGVVHIAPGFGVDDYHIGVQQGIEILAPINEEGKFTEAVNDSTLVGKFYDDTNKEIVERLKSSGKLVSMNWITHSYPHDWRTKKPVIYLATWQWFINIKKLKPEIIKAIENTNFVPAWGKKRMNLMMENRQDWCISRQRAWGVPIPIFYTEKKTPILDKEIINHVSNLFLQHGSNIWYEKDAQDLLPSGYTHPDSPNNTFTKEVDIMDVWYDSGVSHLVVSDKYKLSEPFDLYLEGNDQFRGWFNSSLITGVINNGQSPYKTAVAHGFVNDEKGNKMSKSLGNVISLQDICNQYGSDILRLWTVSVDFQDDSRIGPEILKQVSENYRKIRNLIRFLIGNLSDFPVKEQKPFSEEVFKTLSEVDQFILTKLNKLIISSVKSYESYNFNNIYHEVLNFITNDLSAFYCDFTKDTLYADAINDPRRHQIQTTMFYLVDTLIKLLQPVMPHTCEEAYQNLYFGQMELKTSLMLQSFPKPIKINNEEELLNKWESIYNIRYGINLALTKGIASGDIKNSLSAHVTLLYSKQSKDSPIKSLVDQLEKFHNEPLEKLFIISKFETRENSKESNLADGFYVKTQNGSKCPRCWLTYENVPTDICDRCTQVVEGMKDV